VASLSSVGGIDPYWLGVGAMISLCNGFYGGGRSQVPLRFMVVLCGCAWVWWMVAWWWWVACGARRE
jgi:hypothetical protein